MRSVLTGFRLASALAVFAGGCVLQGCTPSDAEPLESHVPPFALARGVVDIEGGLEIVLAVDGSARHASK